jgi:hypothetical protein
VYKQLIKHRCNPRIGMWLDNIGVGLLVGSTRKKLWVGCIKIGLSVGVSRILCFPPTFSILVLLTITLSVFYSPIYPSFCYPSIGPSLCCLHICLTCARRSNYRSLIVPPIHRPILLLPNKYPHVGGKHKIIPMVG